MVRDVLSSPKVENMKRKRAVRRKRLAILLFVLFVTLTGALAYFSGHEKVVINSISVEGNHIINTSDVEDTAWKDLSGKYLYLFSRSNTLIYPKEKIYKDLRTEFPRIETLSVYRSGIHTLKIVMTERAGEYLYCGASIPLDPTEVGDNCYFINSDGYIFDKAPYFSGNVYFKYYMPLSSSDGTPSSDPLGMQMLPPGEFHALVTFIDSTSSLGLRPVTLSLGDNSMYLLTLWHAQGATAPYIIFKKGDDLSTLFGNLSAAMKSSEFANDIHSKYATLLYIDLRFQDKVLYKFQ